MAIWRLVNHRDIDGVHAFYFTGMVRSLVYSLIGIFTPLYLYNIGLAQYGSVFRAVAIVALYYFVIRLVVFATAIPVSRLIARIGFRRSVALSFVFVAIHLVALVDAEYHLGYIALSALTAGLTVPLYWVSRNSVISQDGVRTEIGRQLGWMVTFEQFATMLGPLIGGFIVVTWGYPVLYRTALALLTLAIIPLWQMQPHVHPNSSSLKGFWYFVTNRRYTHIAVGVGARAIDDYTISVIWPLSVFLMGIKTVSVGGLFTLVSAVSLLVRLAIGKIFDRLYVRRDWSDEIVYSLGAIVSAFLWMGRLFVGTLTGVLWVDIPGALVGTVYSSLYTNYEHLGGMRMGNIAYWVYNEMIYSIAVMSLMGMVVVGAWFGVWKEMAFLMSAFWLVISIVMARESNMR